MGERYAGVAAGGRRRAGHPDEGSRRIFLTGRTAARYKEAVTASPRPPAAV
ncbi:putative protein OS=Streptomyces fumanus OX=67302 GN=GCM10018772_20310 PE=4 SV=1 [Streptomyces fumanus]|uniref:Uncharacterized protein n=1 Tax=Streptomyces fumanus TaxID=67302 RepID=A0A919AAK3_9ACTN|nr:hypothetical protein GCM10018772_20310 [Streptomyces fumanus]